MGAGPALLPAVCALRGRLDDIIVTVEGNVPDPEHAAKIRRRINVLFGSVIATGIGVAVGVGVAEHSIGWGIVVLLCSGIAFTVLGSLVVIVSGETKAILRILKRR
jgi:hypothetical protein